MDNLQNDILKTQEISSRVEMDSVELLDDANQKAHAAVGMAHVAMITNENDESSGFYSQLLDTTKSLQNIIKKLSGI